MKQHSFFLKNMLLVVFLFGITRASIAQTEPMETGKFQPTWESLKQYSQAPDWFRDAKFGIWAHWGPQCQPEQGDWFARFMYFAGSQRNWFNTNFGTDTKLGFKEVMNSWKAESWDADALIKVYKAAGAKYFFALGNHHDNMDLWDSKYQPWNSVKVGPKKDLLAGWEKAARDNGLYFGVSIHATHAWTWYEGSQSYDGNLTQADGTGLWWEGLNPQDLYAQNHAHSTGWDNSGTIHSQWNWTSGASIPSADYCNKFYDRTMDMINKYNPDLVYFDDTSLPLISVDATGSRSTTVSDVGLKIAASYYNKGANKNNGKVNNVIFGKILTESEKECMVWDVERGIPDKPQAKPWETCTCIGDWHYSNSIYNNNQYKSASTVLHMLIDIVSKNGNLLLNIPLKGNGTYDDKEASVLQGITAWMDVNKESIYSTRPWVIFGEGPSAERANALSAQGFNEGSSYDVRDIRYVIKGNILYVTVMGWSTTGSVTLKSLASNLPYLTQNIKSLKILGGTDLAYTRTNEGLTITLPATKPATADIGIAFEIQLENVSFNNLQDLISVSEQTISTAQQNVGTSSGQYNADSIATFQSVISQAKLITASSSTTEIQNAVSKLQTKAISFLTGAKNRGGIINYPYSQNITAKYLKEARIFSRTDAPVLSTSRFGLLAEPWVVTNNIMNQSGVGGFDNYSSSKSIGIQKWNATDPAIVDGKIYQTTILPAGTYKLKIKVHENYGLQTGEDYLSVSVGNTVPATNAVTATALTYYDMSQSSSGSQIECCSFNLTAPTQVAIGWSTSIAATATSRSMRVNEILLLDNGTGTDLSATYLKNYTNIQRKDASCPRFGAATEWISSFNIPQTDGSGTKQGIDKYPGYNTLMLGVWDDVARSTQDATNAKLYKTVTLPAGRYFFGANYQTLTSMGSTYLFASISIPSLANVETTSIAYHKFGTDAVDANVYGIEFTLTEPLTTLNLGWISDLTTATEQEFRVQEVVLLQVLANENYVKSNALSAPASTDLTLKFSEMARATNGNGTYSMIPFNNTGYLVGTSGGTFELGVIDFGTNKYGKMYVNTANLNTITNGASYDVYLDSQSTPFVSISAITTGSVNDFLKSQVTLPSLSGVHKVSLIFNNHTSSLFSAGFVDANPAGINGSSLVCQNSSAIYTVPTIASATSYTWTLPTGATGTSSTNTISVNFGSTAISGSIKVKENTISGTTDESAYWITVNRIPDAANSIVGLTSVCQGDTKVYTVPAIAGATSYLWTLSSGLVGTSSTNSISITFSTTASIETIKVKGRSDCGDGTESSLLVTLNQVPSIPVITLTNGVLQSNASTGNQWYLNTNSIQGAANVTYIPSQNGIYYVTVTNTCGFSTSNAISYIDTKINETLNSNEIHVYPNPTTGLCKIILHAEFDSDYIVSVYNSVGILIHSTKYNNSVREFMLDLSKEESASYVLKIYNAKKEYQKLIIKK